MLPRAGSSRSFLSQDSTPARSSRGKPDSDPRRQSVVNSGFAALGCLITLLFTGLFPSVSCADVIHLKNGGVVRGKIVKQRPSSKSQSGSIKLQTASGSTLTIADAEIESVQRRRMVFEQYELKRRQAADTVEGQWNLAAWCREQGLKKQRATHLERVVELDPGHLEARRGLGHLKYDGQWMSREDYMKRQGKILHRGRYVFPQELDQIRQDETAKKAQRQWHKKVKMWLAWVSHKRAERRIKGVDELSSIRDPHAVPALSKRLRDHPRTDLRHLYVSILSKIEGEESLDALIYQMLADKEKQIRESAIEAIRDDQRNAAVTALTKTLKSDLNQIVNRSAFALGTLGDEHVVPVLIDALITTHKYRVVVPDTGSNSISMAADGSGRTSGSVLPPNIEAMLLSGQLPHGAIVQPPQGGSRRTKTVIVKKVHKNLGVLDALNRLTDANEDFRFDQGRWRLWWSRKNNTVGKSS